MTKFYTNNFNYINLYKKSSKKSEILTQIIHGESFVVLKRTAKWLKIKIKEDGYKGYVENKRYSSYIKPTHKISVLKANVYNKAKRGKVITKLSFGSKIKSEKISNGFSKFDNKWIENKYLKPIKYKNNSLFKNVNIFKGVKYKWGGKTFEGLDCSALIQIFFNFNNKFFPRDTKDQIKYLTNNITLNNIRKNDLIFWRGHVAIAISKTKVIHAYGPEKKTLVMSLYETIDRIERTAKLKVISIKRI